MKWFKDSSRSDCVQESQECYGMAFDEYPLESPAWAVCLTAIETTKRDVVANKLQLPNEPNFWVLTTVLSWLTAMKEIRPSDPPESIVREPAGGLIVEWRVIDAKENEQIEELTFYNTGTIEFTLYRNCKVLEMRTIDINQLSSMQMHVLGVKTRIRKQAGDSVSMHGFQDPESLKYNYSEAYGELEACV